MSRPIRVAIATWALALSSPSHALHYQFTNIVDNVTPIAPPVGSHFGGFDHALAIDGGKVVFIGDYANLFYHSVFIGDGGAPVLVAERGATQIFGVSIDDGVAAFASGGQLFTGADGGIFTGSGGPLSPVVRIGDPAPNGTFTFLHSPSISNGATAFGAIFEQYPTSGVFLSDGGALTTIAKTGDPAPTGSFSYFRLLSLSGNSTSFVADYGTPVQHGVFESNGGAPTTIVKSGDAAPVDSFTDFLYVSKSGDMTAFLGVYDQGQRYGVFTSNGGTITTIAKTGDPAPQGSFLAVGTPSTNGVTTALTGFYEVQGIVTTGIFTGSGGPLQHVISVGDTLFGSTLFNLPEGELDFQTLDIDDDGNIAFFYSLTDGRDGIAVAHPVPEPSTLALAVLVIAFWRAR